jgi:hypothetical protein
MVAIALERFKPGRHAFVAVAADEQVGWCIKGDGGWYKVIKNVPVNSQRNKLLGIQDSQTLRREFRGLRGCRLESRFNAWAPTACEDIVEFSLVSPEHPIDSGRHHGNLSSAIRLFVLNFYREQLLSTDLIIRRKREAIQGLISGSARTSSKSLASD